MKFVALVSGGKDSIYSIQLAQEQGHELVACVHLARPVATEVEESFLYQTAASEAVALQVTECIGVPLILEPRTGTSQNTSLVYEHLHDEDGDEVEDLYRALCKAKQQFPQIQAVSSGAILSTYQRVRIEHVCHRLSLQPLAYLWRKAPQHVLLQDMIHDARIHAVLVKTAAPPGLVPHRHVGKSIQDLQAHFESLHSKYQFHECGEGGEYETLVLDCPLFHKKRLVLEETTIVCEEGQEDIVGTLRIDKCFAQDKETVVAGASDRCNKEKEPAAADTSASKHVSFANDKILIPATASPDKKEENDNEHQQPTPSPPPVFLYPHVCESPGGLWTMSALQSPVGASIQEEAKAVFALLGKLLAFHECTAHDVVYVHLYLTEMKHFALMNTTYQEFFGVILPPSRSTIAVASVSNGSRNMMLDVMVLKGSGKYMRSSGEREESVDDYTTRAHAASSHTRLRNVLHVQSISHWAPVCVGPYSQANTLRDSVHFVSGIIGLRPATMTLATDKENDPCVAQLEQTCTNLARILDALDGSSLHNIVCGTLFIAESLVDDTVMTRIEDTCRQQWKINGGVTVGSIDTGLTKANSDEYEDEGTAAAMMASENVSNGEDIAMNPMLVVSIPQMPVGAQVELETIVATRKASECLIVHDEYCEYSGATANAHVSPLTKFRWDTGHDDTNSLAGKSHKCTMEACFRSLGSDGLHVGVVMLSAPPATECLNLQAALDDVVNLLLRKTPNNWIHLRLYFRKDLDAQAVGLAFQCAVSKRFPDNEPALTVIPVGTLYLFHSSETTTESTINNPLLAVHGLSMDLVRLQDEMWIRHGRS